MVRHELVVMVRDEGSPARRGLCRVIINVIDGNNHVPEFVDKNLIVQVEEDAAVGSSVVKVAAFDRDFGANAQLTYSIEAGTRLAVLRVFCT